MDTLHLERFAYLPDGTFGKLTLPDGATLFTVERPWLENIPFESCIPEGTYRLGYRVSPTSRRTTNQVYQAGWEVEDVMGRTFIMVHPGNWPRNVEGCIAVGTAFAPMKDAKSDSLFAVTNSQTAFRRFQGALNPKGQYQIVVSSKSAK